MLNYAQDSDRIIREQNAEWLGQEEARRIERFTERFKLVSGQGEDLVRDALKKVFTKQEVARRIGIFPNLSINLFRYVTRELFAYQGATRAFRTSSGEDETYARLQKDEVPFDFWMREIAYGLGDYNDCLLQILHGPVDPATGTAGLPRLRLFLPHECSVVADPADASKPMEVRYASLDEDGARYVTVWTALEHYEVHGKTRMPVPGAGDERNPYGRLPFVAIHAGVRGDHFWDENTGQDRFDFALHLLALLSAVDYLMVQYSYKLLVRSELRGKVDPFEYVGPGAELQLISGEKLDIHDLQADPSRLMLVLEKQVSQHLAEYGLDAEDIGLNPGQTPTSGVARALKRQRLIDRRKSVLPFLEEAEYSIAELYRWMWNFNHQDEAIDEAATFDVEIHDEPIVESPREQADARNAQLDVLEKERRLGLRSRLEQLAIDRGLDPTKPEELAKAAEIAQAIDKDAKPAEAPKPPDPGPPPAA